MHILGISGRRLPERMLARRLPRAQASEVA